MMHQDSLEPAAIRFTLERLQDSAFLKVPAVRHNIFSFVTMITLRTIRKILTVWGVRLEK